MKIRITIFLIAVFAVFSFSYPQGMNARVVESNESASKFQGTGEQAEAYVPGFYYEEIFEGDSFPPQGWQAIDVSGDNESWGKDSYGYTGSCAVIYGDKHQTGFGEAGIDWLITPQITVTSEDSLKFYFFSYYGSYGTGTLAIVVSEAQTFATDSLSLEEAFPDTLLLLDNAASPDQQWNEHKLSLEKYAGKQIYIAFKAYGDGGSTSKIDVVKIGHKIGCDIEPRSLNINKYYKTGGVVNLGSGYTNIGSKTAYDIDVYLEIQENGKKFSFHIDSLYPGAQHYISFKDWKLTEMDLGNYTVKSYAVCASDPNSGNDTLTKTCTVVKSVEDLKWISETPMPGTNNELTAASYVKESGSESVADTAFLYAIGGRSNENSYSQILKYNAVSRVWNSAVSMPEPKAGARAVRIKDKIYILPGYDIESGYTTGITKFYIYDINADTIGIGAEYPGAPMLYNAGVYGDSLIYIIGATNGLDLNAGVDIYNINTDTWHTGTPFAEKGRRFIGGTICGNTIVLVGGDLYNERASTVNIGLIDPADPYSITWKTDEYPGGQVTGISSGAWSGKDKKYVIFAGGNGYGNMNPSTWIYDVENGGWLGAPNRITSAYYSSDMVPVIRNDSVFMAILGGKDVMFSSLSNNEWLYIGPSDKGLEKPDVAPYSVDFDTAAVTLAFNPKATFTNKRLPAAENFEVTMEITPGDYKSVKTVSSLAAKTRKQVEFAAWTPTVEGEYTVKIYTSLSGDVDKTNDTLSFTALALATDLELDNLYIERIVSLGQEIYPLASFYNNKNLPVKSFPVTIKITPGDYTDTKTVEVINGNSYGTVEFGKWVPAELGKYNVSVYTDLNSDVDRSNDTISASIAVMEKLFEGGWFSNTAPFSSRIKPSVYYTKKAAEETGVDSGFIFMLATQNDGLKYKLAVNNDEADSSLIFNINTETWTQAATLPVFLSPSSFSPAYAEGKIYVPGGTEESETRYGSVNTLYIYDINSNKWTLGVPMPKAASGYTVAVYGDTLIYVIGGIYQEYDSVVVYKNAQIYNVKTGIWTETADFFDQAVISASGTILKNKIVLAGGYNSAMIFANISIMKNVKSSGYSPEKMKNLSDKVYIGDIDTENPYNISWETGTCIGGGFYGSAVSSRATKDGGYVFFAGGRSDYEQYLPYTLAFDPYNKKWFSAPDLDVPVSRAWGVTPVRNDSVFFAAIGGYDDDYTVGLIQWLYLGPVVKDSVVGISDGGMAPLTYSLSQNYPNPFNPTTTIRYSVAAAGKVELKVFNMLGQEIRTLVNEVKSSGVYEVKFNAAGMNLASGAYFYRIKAGDFVQTKKLMLIK